LEYERGVDLEMYQRGSPMLRYRADIKTLVFVAIYFGLVALQWILAPTDLAVAIPLLVLTCWFSFFGAVATHNTVHAPVFHPRWANRLFQVALTLTYGHPVSAYVPGHNLSHHKYTQSRKDVMRTTKTARTSSSRTCATSRPCTGGTRRGSGR
jgi:fatty acid desaturase